jgi:hypothetical protein
MKMFRFRDRVGILDERSRHCLTTVAWLGGYVTPEQVQLLGIRNSCTRVHEQLKDLESWGFLKRIAAYPAICQVTKSVTRLIGFDLSARRGHTLETIRTRLLTVNFYLEAAHWPVEFVFQNAQKITRLTQLGCEPALLPERRRRPYLWQDLVLERPSGELVVALADHFDRHSYRQLYRLLQRFAPNFGSEQLKFMVVVGSEQRERLYRRHLRHPRLQRLLEAQGMYMPPEDMVAIYRVRRAVPVVRPLITDRQQLRELRGLRLASQGLKESRQQTSHAIVNDAH